MHIYCKNCKNHTDITFPKELILISKDKTKRKRKCVICLTEGTLSHKIEDKYGLESELEIYLQFFTN